MFHSFFFFSFNSMTKHRYHHFCCFLLSLQKCGFFSGLLHRCWNPVQKPDVTVTKARVVTKLRHHEGEKRWLPRMVAASERTCDVSWCSTGMLSFFLPLPPPDLFLRSEFLSSLLKFFSLRLRCGAASSEPPPRLLLRTWLMWGVRCFIRTWKKIGFFYRAEMCNFCLHF